MSPDGPKNIPPEEKLLRLIRGSGAAANPSQAALPEAQAPAANEPAAPRSSRLWRQGTSWWRRIRVGDPEQSITWLIAMEIFLGAVVVVEATIMLLLWVQPLPDSSALPSASQTPDLAASAQRAESSATGEAPPPLPSLVTAASRPLFRSLDPTRAPDASRSSSTPMSEQLSALANRLSVIGIIAGDPPQAIIEDAQTKKTYFVSVGQTVVEGLVVESIEEHRVVFSLNGQTMQLSL